jgi:hypothetical protein
MTYVQWRANRYEFRYRLPDDLAGKAVPPRFPSSLSSIVNPSAGRFKREVVRSLRSLRTNDPVEAKRKVLSHIAGAQTAIDEARRFLREGPTAVVTPHMLEALARAHEVKIVGGGQACQR